TGKTHTFRRRGVPSWFRMQLARNGEPRANEPFKLTIDGVEVRGTTDGEGVLAVRVSPHARQVKLSIGEDDNGDEYEVEIGGLLPINALSGVQQRLNNLGYPCGEPDGEMNDATRTALHEFQLVAGLKVSGEPDDATR